MFEEHKEDIALAFEELIEEEEAKGNFIFDEVPTTRVLTVRTTSCVVLPKPCYACDWCGSLSLASPSPLAGAPHASPPRPVLPEHFVASLALALDRVRHGIGPVERGRRHPTPGSPRSARSPWPRRGDFTGYGFDQCLAPTQSAMDTWWKKSPFPAVGIYISGDSRACRSQPNLSPTWVAHPARPRLAAAADRARPPGVVPAAVPALQGRLQDQPEARPAGTPRRPRQGTAEADKNAADAMALRHRAGQHALVRPRGLQPQQHPLPRVRAGVRSAG